jgi:hypothetical protein
MVFLIYFSIEINMTKGLEPAIENIFRDRMELIYFHAFGEQIQPGFGVTDEVFRAL